MFLEVVKLLHNFIVSTVLVVNETVLNGMCWIMEKINISIKCTGWNGRKEYQYKMCWMEWRKGILVQNVLDGMEDGNTSITSAGWNGRWEYQYKMCWMKWKKGILV